MTSIGGLKTFTYATYRDGTEKVSSDHIKNKSDVAGSTVSDALDYLLDNAGGGVGDAYLPVSVGTAGTHLRSDGTDAIWSNLINLAPGTLGAPSLTFVGDLDTGIYSPASGVIASVINGTTQASVSVDGITSTNYLIAPKLKINNNVALGNTLISDATGEFFATPMQTALQSANSFGVNTFIGQSAGTNGSGFNYVVGIGYQSFGGFAGLPTSATSGSLAVGQGTLYSITSGARNSALGFQSQSSIDTGSDNTTLGYQSMQAGNGAVSNCTAFGSQTLAGALTTGANGSTAIGMMALNALTSGVNTAIGKDSQKLITTGTGNTTIGLRTMDASGVNVNSCTAVGHDALGGVLTNGANGSTAMGYQALTTLTSGSLNTGIGYQNQLVITDGANNTTMGYGVLGNSSNAGDLSNCVGIGANCLTGVLTTGANGTVGVGYSAFQALTNGGSNTGIGYQNQKLSTTGNNNTTVGYNVMNNSATGCANNVGIGSWALGGALTTGANGSTAVGTYALTALTSGAGNTAVGYNSQQSLTTGASNTTVGSSTMAQSANNVNYCVGVGDYALGGTLTNGANGSTAVGTYALTALTSGAKNTAVGYNAGSAITTGVNNTMIGYGTSVNGASEYNTYIGASSGSTGTRKNNTVVGSLSFISGTGNNQNNCVIVGDNAMKATTSSSVSGTVCIGSSALTALTTGSNNTAVGYLSGNTLTTGANNTLLGYNTQVDTASRAGCTILGSGGASTADNQFSLALGGTNVFRSLMTSTAKGASTATIPADCDYMIVSIVPAGGGAPITRYIPLYTSP